MQPQFRRTRPDEDSLHTGGFTGSIMPSRINAIPRRRRLERHDRSPGRFVRCAGSPLNAKFKRDSKMLAPGVLVSSLSGHDGFSIAEYCDMSRQTTTARDSRTAPEESRTKRSRVPPQPATSWGDAHPLGTARQPHSFMRNRAYEKSGPDDWR
jgi:hypothetical protein